MKKKKETAVSPGKEKLKKELKKKSSALEKLKREIKIEAALECVRARTMAMHRTSELQEVVNILAQQLYNINIDINGGVSICINDEVDKDIPLWASSGATNYMQKVVVPLLDKPILTRIKNAIKKRNNFFVEEYSKEEKMEFFKHLFRHSPWNSSPQERKEQLLSTKGGYTRSVAVCNYTSIAINNHNGKKLSDEENEILKRFAKVFEQTYTRFLDLQKAEEQARESQIQLALERVRARSLAMHGSNELVDVVTILNEQLQHLGLLMEMRSAAILIFEQGKKDYTQWIASPLYDKAFSLETLYLDNRIQNDIWEARQNKTDYYSKEYSIEEKNELFQFYFKQPAFSIFSEEEKKVILESAHYELALAFEKNSSLGIAGLTGNLLSNEEGEIVKRAAKVFEQAYIRFLDLKNAEAQTREAQIEAALERVRSRSMGMQKSEELKEVIQVVYEQFVHLNILVEHTGFIIDYKERDDMHIWLADKHEVPSEVTIPYFDSPHWNSFIEAKEKGIDFFANLLSFEEKNKFYHDLFKIIPGVPEETLQYYFSCPGLAGSTVLLDNVGLYIENFSGIPYTDEENNTLMRFGKVFQQTYTRFLDLQRAEAQTREAIKRASVDRVRAEIASMRTTTDLERITPLIWNELKTLGVPFSRCGVFIMDEEKQEVQTLLSAPDGKAIATLHVPFTFDLPIIYNGVDHWRKKKIYKEHWDANEFIRSWTALSSLSETAEDSHQREHPPENLYLHMLPFLQGTLYVGNDAPLSEDELQLVQNLADAFSTAYARYEDFNKLEAAKQQIEKTLFDLKQTQAQLVQAEKMASLGELTAGIAHEIQNPLNFVNNFSEVNAELIEELNAERLKPNAERNKELENEILNDLKENEQKINHHGKRADAIVKGMLQHSRSSTGQKEATNINALADEYLRLAYHGLRAKDKSFNSEMKTDFDESIGKINIVPQDIGRVLLNLYNNAFYAVSEKAKLSADSYQPIVKVSTRKGYDQIEIRVEDNGNGIPQKILDKIFQPFFTTKPTGKGTGLGLSLAYDIIKAHGGEIKVETKENEGTEFIIQLPVV